MNSNDNNFSLSLKDHTDILIKQSQDAGYTLEEAVNYCLEIAERFKEADSIINI
ncbi:MAG: hypothetical protein J1E81_07615 [Eubacterium sp.]|nr:hypothetical protein [Eubacterium sp.]